MGNDGLDILGISGQREQIVGDGLVMLSADLEVEFSEQIQGMIYRPFD